jgi:hypothetical protein
MKSITAFFISIALFFLSIFTPELPAPKSDAELEQIASICQKHELGDKLYVIDVSALKEDGAKHTAIALQGIVLVTLDELMAMIENNVPHQDAKVQS